MKKHTKHALFLLTMLLLNLTTYGQTNTKYWDGGPTAVGTAWSVAENWYPDGVPTANDHVIINTEYARLQPSGTLPGAFVVQLDMDATVKSLTIETKVVTPAPGSGDRHPITLEINKMLTIAEGLTVSADAMMEVRSSLATITVGGNWNNAGLFRHGNGTVNFNQPGTHNIVATNVYESYVHPTSHSYTAAVGQPDEHANAFYNLTFIDGTTELGSYLRVENDLTIQNQTTKLNPSNSGYTIELWGKWQNEGTFEPKAGKIIFASTLPQTVGKGFRTAAQASATVAGGTLTAISINNAGDKYATAPVVIIEGGNGYGAKANATIDAQGKVIAVSLLNGGAGYTSTPTVRFVAVAKEDFYNIDIYKPFNPVTLLTRTEAINTVDFKYGNIVSGTARECIIQGQAITTNGYVDGPMGRLYNATVFTSQNYAVGKGSQYAGNILLSLGLDAVSMSGDGGKALYIVERFNSKPANGRVVPSSADANVLLDVHYRVQQVPYPFITSSYPMSNAGADMNFSSAKIGIPLNLNVESFTNNGTVTKLNTLPVADLNNFRILADAGDLSSSPGQSKKGLDTEVPYHTPGVDWINLGGENAINSSLGAATVLPSTSSFNQLGSGVFALAIKHNGLGGKNNQTITFNPLATKTFGNAAFNLSATASSGLAVTYASSNTSVATVSGNKITITGAGTTTITAKQTGNASYEAATPVSQTLTVNKASQSITFGALSAKTFGGADFSLSATASSNLAVTYASSNTNVATVSGNKITIVGVGTTTITASQAGNANYTSAVSKTQTFTVNKASQSITFGTLPTKAFGDADFSLSATASSNLAVTYASSNTNVATVSGNKITIVGAGTTTITASQAGNANYTSAAGKTQILTVNKAHQIITFDALGSKGVSDADFSLSATASSGLTVTYSSSNLSVATISGNTVTIVGVGTTTILASQAGNANYYTADGVIRTLTVAEGSQTITFGTLSAKTFGDADFSLSATASSGLTITYASSNTSVATVSGSKVTIIGAGTTTITASQAGNASYAAANSVSQNLTINKANQSITFGALPAKTFGDADFNLSATANSGLAVTYASSNANVATVSGSKVTIIGAGTTTITASQAGNTNYAVANNVSQSLTVSNGNSVPASPQNLQRTNPQSDHSKAVLTWEDKSDNETGFHIKRSLNNQATSFEVIATVAANVTTYTDIFANSNTDLHYQVVAYNEVGISAPTNTLSIIAVGVSNLVNEPAISLYPNPVENVFTVQLDGVSPSAKIGLTIVGLQGQLVKDLGAWSQQELTSQRFDISELTRGTYLLEIVAGKKKMTRRIMKQ